MSLPRASFKKLKKKKFCLGALLGLTSRRLRSGSDLIAGCVKIRESIHSAGQGNVQRASEHEFESLLKWKTNEKTIEPIRICGEYNAAVRYQGMQVIFFSQDLVCDIFLFLMISVLQL